VSADSAVSDTLAARDSWRVDQLNDDALSCEKNGELGLLVYCMQLTATGLSRGHAGLVEVGCAMSRQNLLRKLLA
jgi:hypothetical protein